MATLLRTVQRAVSRASKSTSKKTRGTRKGTRRRKRGGISSTKFDKLPRNAQKAFFAKLNDARKAVAGFVISRLKGIGFELKKKAKDKVVQGTTALALTELMLKPSSRRVAKRVIVSFAAGAGAGGASVSAYEQLQRETRKKVKSSVREAVMEDELTKAGYPGRGIEDVPRARLKQDIRKRTKKRVDAMEDNIEEEVNRLLGRPTPKQIRRRPGRPKGSSDSVRRTRRTNKELGKS